MLDITQQAELKDLLNQKLKIVLITHTNPDGDAIGSAMAMYHYLRKKGHIVTAMVSNKFPEFLNWLPDSDKMIIHEQQPKLLKAALLDSDLIFCLDFNALNRSGSIFDLLQVNTSKRVLIDHHLEPEIASFDYILSNTKASSTGELVFEFIHLMGDSALMDEKIAACIYACIVTDTGSFSYACNNGTTFNVVAELINHGIDVEKIHRQIYDTFSENRLRLLGHAISERMIVWPNFHTAIIYLTREDLHDYNYQVGDTEGIVNYPLSMKKVNMSVLITEKDKKVRMSFRSKGSFDVNLFARKYFNGGGHRNAAGGNTSLNVEQSIEKLKEAIASSSGALNYTEA